MTLVSKASVEIEKIWKAQNYWNIATIESYLLIEPIIKILPETGVEDNTFDTSILLDMLAISSSVWSPISTAATGVVALVNCKSELPCEATAEWHLGLLKKININDISK